MPSTKLYSLVEMTVSGTPGTGTITLGAATAANRFTFAEAGVPNGAVVSYVVRDGTDIEYGYGTYTSSGTTLARTAVRASKIGGTAGTSKINLTSAATVWIDAAAQDLDVNDFTAETALAAADELWIHDVSAAAKRKATLENVILGGAASQAEMEAGSALNRAVTPGRAQYHPGVAKAWAFTTVAGGSPTIQSSYNITSVSDDGVGQFTYTIATDFSSANWAAAGMALNVATNEQVSYRTVPAAGSVAIYILPGPSDATHSIVMHGDQ